MISQEIRLLVTSVVIRATNLYANFAYKTIELVDAGVYQCKFYGTG